MIIKKIIEKEKEMKMWIYNPSNNHLGYVWIYNSTHPWGEMVQPYKYTIKLWCGHRKFVKWSKKKFFRYWWENFPVKHSPSFASCSIFVITVKEILKYLKSKKMNNILLEFLPQEWVKKIKEKYPHSRILNSTTIILIF